MTVRMLNGRIFTSTRAGVAALGLATAALVAGIASADDRDLLRDRAADPYVFIVFDTSGSMNWTPVCNGVDACEDIDPYDRACTSECELGSEDCPRLCPDYGCLEFGDRDLAPPLAFTVDDTDMSSVSIVGAWTMTSAFVGTAFGGSAISDGGPDRDEKHVTFSVEVAETRRYKVFISVPQSDQWATNVSVRVEGTVHAETVRINQRFIVPPLADDEEAPEYDPWRLVGVYAFDAGATATVRLSNDDTDGPVVVDGVKFESEVKECLREGYRCVVPLCPEGNCHLPLNQGDPGSKFFQAKQALFEVIDDVPFVRFGFSTFEQDSLRVNSKHWLYRVRELEVDPDPLDGIDPPAQALIALPGGTLFPQPDDDDVFGVGNSGTTGPWACDHNQLADDAGCFRNEPAYLFDVFEEGRLHRIPKLGRKGNQETQIWITTNADDSDPLRVTYSLEAGSFGDSVIKVRTRVERCSNSSCGSPSLVGEEVIAYDLRSDFLGRELDVQPMGFQIRRAEDARASGGATCGSASTPSGWDPNSDTNQDTFDNINLRWPSTSDPRSTSNNQRAFDTGDVIPWDWLTGAHHTVEIQERLAPNTVTDASAFPDFRVATFLAEPPGDTILDLADADASDGIERPLIAWGATPLGGILRSINKWHTDFANEAREGGTPGDPWVDPDWACREKFVVMLTDGDETCSPFNGVDPCNFATTLNNNQIKTFVVAFGFPERPFNRLNCIAANGGTQRPFYPRNKDELVATLKSIFGEVEARARSFASAALPAVQATAADKILFSSFTPLPGEPFWPGRVDVIRQPVVDTIERMVCERGCDRQNLESGCQVFNAGDTILAQAPTDSEIDDAQPDANMGEGRFERRVLYPLAYRPVSSDGTLRQPLPMQLFELPDLDMPSPLERPIIEDLLQVMVRPSELDTSQTLTAQLLTVKDTLKETYRNLFRKKNSPDLADSPFACPARPSGAPATYQPGDYLLGDVFHTTTTVASGPAKLEFLRQDRCGAGTHNTPNNCVAFTATEVADAETRGYRNYARRGSWYRNMLVVGANDGQLHFFDAGVRAEVEGREIVTDGSGAELFAFMPRLVMPIIREQARPGNSRQIYSVDGSFAINDVFVDPAFETAPSDDEREWRRVLIGGLREGGDRFDDNRAIEGFVSGYYALDITQPDGLESINDDALDPTESSIVDNEYIPDGLNAQVRVIDGGADAVRWVAIFAGGVDPASFDPATRGNWLYMVDIETGATIYKRQLTGAVPADLTGSVDEKGILTTLYIGTTAGLMYKVDMRRAAALVATPITSDQIIGWPDTSSVDVRRISDPGWEPFVIFDTNGKPIYQTPALIHVPELDKVALAWGSGDREDLWRFAATPGRFYVIVDDDFTPGDAALPLTEPDLVTFDFNAPLVGFDPVTGEALANTPDFLTDTVRTTNDGQPAARGWIMRFPVDARVTSRASAISGVLVFTVFQPRVNPATGSDAPCRRSGLARTFIVDIRNGDALTALENIRDPDLAIDRALRGGDGDGAAASGINVSGGPSAEGSCGDRCIQNEGLPTSPSVESYATVNPVAAPTTVASDPLDDPITKRLLENIKRNFFPPGCRFNDNFVHRIRMQLDNTELRDIAPVPIAVCPSDWAEGAPLWLEDS